ncbi:MAG: chemotaxis protein CheW [Lautropia sp.]|nr:chemotaxis protein CheW [Lautropia sp.]
METTDLLQPETHAASAAGNRAAESASATHLALMIGNSRYLVDLAEAGEIVPMPPTILQVPLTFDWFVGVVNVRGSLFTVVDLSRFMGGGGTPITKESRLVTVSPALQFNTTLVVSRMMGLRNSASMKPVDGKPADDMPWLGQCFEDREGHVWCRLSLSKLVASSAFLMVGR